PGRMAEICQDGAGDACAAPADCTSAVAPITEQVAASATYIRDRMMAPAFTTGFVVNFPLRKRIVNGPLRSRRQSRAVYWSEVRQLLSGVCRHGRPDDARVVEQGGRHDPGLQPGQLRQELFGLLAD